LPRVLRLTFPWIYLRGFFGRIFLNALLTLALVETIFISDKLNDIIVTVLDQRAPIVFIPLLVLLRMPDVFGLALPIAVLTACYHVALQARESREFQVFAGIGVSTRRLIGVAWVIGMVAMLVSLAVSGLLAPASQYATRYLLFDARYAALHGAASPGVFFGFGDYTIFVPPNTGGDEAKRLYIHLREPGSNDTDRVIIADDGHLEGLYGSGSKILHLQNPTIVGFFNQDRTGRDGATRAASCPDCGPARHSMIASVFQAQRIAQDIDLGALNYFPARGSYLSEASLPELLDRVPEFADERGRAVEVGRRLGRCFLCLVTPLLAGVALAITGRLNHALVVSASVAILFGLDLAVAGLVEACGNLGLITILFVAMAPAALVALVVNAVAYRGKADLTMPTMART
jgi:lipopolysaccharide export system permease protein